MCTTTSRQANQPTGGHATPGAAAARGGRGDPWPHRWADPAGSTLRCEDCGYLAAASYRRHIPPCTRRWHWEFEGEEIGCTVEVEAIRYEVQPLDAGPTAEWTARRQRPQRSSEWIGLTYRDAQEAMSACSRTAGEPEARHSWPIKRRGADPVASAGESKSGGD